MHVEKTGIENTDATLDAAFATAMARGVASDAGLVPPADVIAVAGTGRGADTCCLIRGNSSNRFFEIKVKKIITKPKEF